MFGRASRLFAVTTALFLPACLAPGEGPKPPAEAMYFPVGLAVSPGGHTLYVANSDFDLQYNGGTVLALDLDRVRASIPPLWETPTPEAACGDLGVQHLSDRLLFPSICGPISIVSPPDGGGTLAVGSTEIGAFATDIQLVARQAPPEVGVGPDVVRLFVPVRGDPSLTWIDVDDDSDGLTQRRFDCGQTADSARCDASHRAGEDPNANLRRVVMPPEPYGMAATETGDAILVTHQTAGAVSLVTNPWDGVPALQFVLGGLPFGAVGVEALPVPEYVTQNNVPHHPGFLTTFRAAAEVDLLRYYDDQAAAPARPFVVRAGAVGITVNASGVDSRGIAIDASERKDCERACNANSDCLLECASVPAHVYIANRAPPSLLIGETRANVSAFGSDDLVTLYDTVPIAFGPSRVALGTIIDRDGVRRQRVFVSCFDARFVFIYDPEGHRIEGQIRTGRGPHALAFDPQSPLMYVAHFTDSYVGAVDLDQRHAATYGTIVASVGQPVPPRESK